MRKGFTQAVAKAVAQAFVRVVAQIGAQTGVQIVEPQLIKMLHFVNLTQNLIN